MNENPKYDTNSYKDFLELLAEIVHDYLIQQSADKTPQQKDTDIFDNTK